MNQSHPRDADAQQNGSQTRHPEDPEGVQVGGTLDGRRMGKSQCCGSTHFFLSLAQSQGQGRLPMGLAELVHFNNVKDQAVA